MRKYFLAPIFSLLTCAAALAANPPDGSALSAIKLLPKGEAKKIARIEARDGTPLPERWHVIVHDPKQETGVREYVIAGGEVVASRSISQFAESVRPADVIGGEAVKIDSDRLARVAQQYAFANDVTIGSLNYELKREGAAASPLWNVTCLDEDGKELGRLVISAGKGSVVSHEGFAIEPAPPAPAAERVRSQPRAQVTVTIEGGSRPADVRRAEPAQVFDTPAPEDDRRDRRPGFFGRVGGHFQKFITGRNPNDR